ncbi:MAG: recombinase family protein [Deltaproteobacteria bacterium]|nr:recombinase family protein [Deltaproteobacteria bacterium]
MASTPRRVALYARVSTNDQKADLQLDGLRRLAEQRGWKVAGEYVDEGYSGTKDRRPALDKLMADSRKGRFEVVAVWRFDRWARSVRHLVVTLDDFRERAIDFISVNDGIDTSTAAGRMVFAVVAAMAAYEADAIKERTKAGVAAARRRGKRIGRPERRFDLDEAMQLRDEGLSIREIASRMNVGRSIVHRALAGAVPQVPPASPSATPEISVSPAA